MQVKASKGRECFGTVDAFVQASLKNKGRDHRFQPSLIESLQPKKGRMESLKGHVDSNTGQTGISSGSGKGQEKKTGQALPRSTLAKGRRLLVEAH